MARRVGPCRRANVPCTPASIRADAWRRCFVAAISQCWSALVQRTRLSTVLSNLSVFALTVGTLIVFGLALPATRGTHTTTEQVPDESRIQAELQSGKFNPDEIPMTTQTVTKDEIRTKEIKGLIKEIMWLKAKCRREERLRKDLAWSKALLEQNEAMRVEWYVCDGPYFLRYLLTTATATELISTFWARWAFRWISASTRSSYGRCRSSGPASLLSWRPFA